jgi:sec-independent protein translocase protein TatB/colicin import membrane protein
VFGIGETELVIILLFAFMIFGPDKLPGIGRTVGRALRQFRDAQEGFTKVVQTEIVDPATEAMSDAPKKPNRKREAAADDDADIDSSEAGASSRPDKTETFAERKKRLAAEKAAREAAAAEAPAEPVVADASAPAADVDSDSDVDASAVAEVEAPEAAPEVAPAPEAEEPKPASAKDLYSMRPTRTARAKKPTAAAPVETDATAPAPVEEPAAQTGKEDGSEEA